MGEVRTRPISLRTPGKELDLMNWGAAQEIPEIDWLWKFKY